MSRRTRKNIGGSETYIPHPKELLNKLYIISGSHETNNLDKVNRTSRFKICPSDGLSFHLGKKIGYLTDRCTGTDQEALREPACTYGNLLQFTGPTLKDSSFMGKTKYISFDQFWSNFFKFIKTIHHGYVLSLKSRNITKKPNTMNFFLTTHHNRLKKTIFEAILDKDKKNRIHFANCSCIKILITDGSVKIECLYEGFPDKEDMVYLPSGEITDQGANNFGFLNDKIKHFKEWIVSSQNLGLVEPNINIFIIRHGNAFHNKPLKIGNRNYFKRPLDSCLTPLGIYQAHYLANFLIDNGHLTTQNPNIFCSSYMNRAQLTTIELAAALDFSDSFLNFQTLMRKMSMARLFRILGKDINIWKAKMKKLSEHFSSDNLPGSNEQKYNQLIEISKDVIKYHNSCEKFMHLPTVKIPTEGTLIFDPPYSSNSLRVDFYTNLMKLSRYEILKGGSKRKTKKINYKKKRKNKRKKRTKKITLKKKH
jgi:hypothetical protein